MQPTTIQPSGSLSVSSLNRRKFIGLLELSEDVIGFYGCPIGDKAGVEPSEFVAEVFDLRASFLAVFLYVLVEVFDGV